MGAIFDHHQTIIGRLQNLMMSQEDLSLIVPNLSTHFRTNQECFFNQENLYPGQVILRRLRCLYPTFNRGKQRQYPMKYEEIVRASAAFRAKTDIRDKGVAMCELT